MAENNNTNEPSYMTLEFDNGDVVECEELGVFESDGDDYIALIPLDDSDDVYIYGYEEDGDEFNIFDVKNDEAFEKACKEFDRIVKEMK